MKFIVTIDEKTLGKDNVGVNISAEGLTMTSGDLAADIAALDMENVIARMFGDLIGRSSPSVVAAATLLKRTLEKDGDSREGISSHPHGEIVDRDLAAKRAYAALFNAVLAISSIEKPERTDAKRFLLSIETACKLINHVKIEGIPT